MAERLRRIEAWLARHTNYGGPPVAGPVRAELEPIRSMLEGAGRPQDHCPGVQVAGTRGKGTTAHFLARLLALRGFRVGLYTSPHLIRLTERIRVDGEEIGAGELEGALARARELPSAGQAGFFDLMTAAAALHFRDAGVEVAIWEAGKGGEADATTALGADLFLLTNVGEDHAARLGRTRLERARAKAAALRPGAVFVSGLPFGGPEWALAQGLARSRGARLYGLGREFFFRGVEWSPGERLVRVDLHASAAGLRQEGVRVRNHARLFDADAALAQAAVMILGEEVAGLAAGAQPLAEPALLEPPPGRFQVARLDPPLVFDGAQSPRAFAAVLADWNTLFGANRPPRVLLALGRERAAAAIMRSLAAGGAGGVHALQVDPRRGLEPERIVDLARAEGLPAEPFPGDPAAARRMLATTADPWLVTGSIYLVGRLIAEFAD